MKRNTAAPAANAESAATSSRMPTNASSASRDGEHDDAERQRQRQQRGEVIGEAFFGACGGEEAERGRFGPGERPACAPASTPTAPARSGRNPPGSSGA